MKMLLIAACTTTLAIASPALADVATISECEIIDRDTAQPILFCDIQNHSERAIASVRFRAIVKSPDREVSWAKIPRGSDFATTLISGGIEPGETINERMSALVLDKRAEGLPLEVQITEIDFLDVNGEMLTSSDADLTIPHVTTDPASKAVDEGLKAVDDGLKAVDDALSDVFGSD